MKKIILILFGLIICSNALALKVGSEEEVVEALKKGGNIVFIRHAYAPRVNNKFEPDDFYSGSLKKKDCSVQRDLDDRGLAQAKAIGAVFKDNNIKIDKVLTSIYCRCFKTAEEISNDYEISKMIISIGRGNVSKKKKQLKKIRKYIEKWDSDKNLVIVSHFNVINPLFEKSLLSISSGEIVVSDKDFNILANWKVPY
ncbi:histidine phosphatase family protein [Candidatus Pelagibacter sp. HIMB1593]|uniref:histidine phosphatase family protein n=1 Tax=Candidatus Pelagibacter sp. HIMB1593 TaxID=3413355 RepID=UPI003F84FF96